MDADLVHFAEEIEQPKVTQNQAHDFQLAVVQATRGPTQKLDV